MPDAARPGPDTWPELPLEAWADTSATLHLWMQIVGKVRLAQSAWLNHSWHVTLYPTTRGLTTSPIPHGTRFFQLDFDFIDHRLVLQTSDGGVGGFALQPQCVATFYRALLRELDRMDLHVDIHRFPNEVADAIRFDRDTVHCSYDAMYANRYWRVLTQAARVFNVFRAGFAGKCSPVHVFWGAPDLAVTRFSGRAAPMHPGGIPNLPDWVARDAYSQEVSSCGFWAGGDPVPYAAFYAYAYPAPPRFDEAVVQPPAAFYQRELGEFILPYDAVRLADDPDTTLLAFLQSTYDAAATLGDWDRDRLERRRS
ncbi:MAG: hypothetical protein JWL98_571 [Xanthomonadaceae bacterium]|nr:hypothetical protein [Xanthomonadaceae bacterium]